MQETTVATGTTPTSDELPLLRQPVHIVAAWLVIFVTVFSEANFIVLKPTVKLAILGLLAGAMLVRLHALSVRHDPRVQPLLEIEPNLVPITVSAAELKLESPTDLRQSDR